jgi:hypothetical protein
MLLGLLAALVQRNRVLKNVSFRAIKNGYPAEKLLNPPPSVRILNVQILIAAIADA